MTIPQPIWFDEESYRYTGDSQILCGDEKPMVLAELDPTGSLDARPVAKLGRKMAAANELYTALREALRVLEDDSNTTPRATAREMARKALTSADGR